MTVFYQQHLKLSTINVIIVSLNVVFSTPNDIFIIKRFFSYEVAIKIAVLSQDSQNLVNGLLPFILFILFILFLWNTRVNQG